MKCKDVILLMTINELNMCVGEIAQCEFKNYDLKFDTEENELISYSIILEAIATKKITSPHMSPRKAKAILDLINKFNCVQGDINNKEVI